MAHSVANRPWNIIKFSNTDGLQHKPNNSLFHDNKLHRNHVIQYRLVFNYFVSFCIMSVSHFRFQSSTLAPSVYLVTPTFYLPFLTLLFLLFHSSPIFSALLVRLFHLPFCQSFFPLSCYAFFFSSVLSLLPRHIHYTYSIVVLILSYIRFNLTPFLFRLLHPQCSRGLRRAIHHPIFIAAGVKEYVTHLCFSVSYQQISDICILPQQLL